MPARSSRSPTRDGALLDAGRRLPPLGRDDAATGERARQHIYFIGNGAQRDDGEPLRRRRLQERGASGAMAFNDASLLTAIGNDVAFDEVFALPLERLARAGDLLIAISSSGNSPNIVRALEAARGDGAVGS